MVCLPLRCFCEHIRFIMIFFIRKLKNILLYNGVDIVYKCIMLLFYSVLFVFIICCDVLVIFLRMLIVFPKCVCVEIILFGAIELSVKF